MASENKKKEHLKKRAEIAKKRPKFVMQCYGRRKRVKARWRYPTGIHSKLRHRKAGHIPVVSTGWRSPADIRGLHSSGLEMVIVSNIKELEKIKKESQGVIISSKVGMKKRMEIIRKAQQQGIEVLNLDAEKYLTKAEEEFKKRVEKKKEASQTKEKKMREREEAASKKEKESQNENKEISAEEKKEEEIKEMEKVLTSKE
ncbi:MAG: 50S ribosomal protein L32e [Candidatus Woesearchaeota archaeon]